jgi:hypothetical protein
VNNFATATAAASCKLGLSSLPAAADDEIINGEARRLDDREGPVRYVKGPEFVKAILHATNCDEAYSTSRREVGTSGSVCMRLADTHSRNKRGRNASDGH